jgi:hypothetical protein
MESLRNNHEESAYIFVKLKEMLEQQDKLECLIGDDNECLSMLKENIIVNKSSIRKNIEDIKARLNNIKK